MANVHGIEVSGTTYDLEDTTARDTATTASQTATTASQTATTASQTATTASQTAAAASQSVSTLSTTVTTHTQQITNLNRNKATYTHLYLQTNTDLIASTFTQMVYDELGTYPNDGVFSITLQLNGHTFSPTYGSDLAGDYIIFVASGMENVSELPDPNFWGGSYGRYMLFRENNNYPEFGDFAFMWGNALDSDDPSLATIYIN